jgi:D-lactate dehydrogenase
VYNDYKLNADTVMLAKGYDAVCIFVDDICDAEVLKIKVARVPAYSPFSVAEDTLALLLYLNRKIHKACNRVKEGNFNIERLDGFKLIPYL